MKNLLLTLIVCCFITAAIFAQGPRSEIKTMEIVVEVPNADTDKTWSDLNHQLSGIDNVWVEGYCLNQNLLYLRLDPAQYFKVLVAINKAGYTYYLKKDLNVNSGIEACNIKSNLILRESSSLY